LDSWDLEIFGLLDFWIFEFWVFEILRIWDWGAAFFQDLWSLNF